MTCVMKRILFVCTGNICRSPAAEAMLRHHLKEAGLEQKYDICSAGTHGYHVGERPSQRGFEVARSYGISMEGMTARKVQLQDFDRFEHIIAMDQGHLDILERLRPAQSKARLSLYSEYCTENDIIDVADPYYGTIDDYYEVWRILEDGTKGLIKFLEEQEL